MMDMRYSDGKFDLAASTDEERKTSESAKDQLLYKGTGTLIPRLKICSNNSDEVSSASSKEMRDTLMN